MYPCTHVTLVVCHCRLGCRLKVGLGFPLEVQKCPLVGGECPLVGECPPVVGECPPVEEAWLLEEEGGYPKAEEQSFLVRLRRTLLGWVAEATFN